MIILFYASINEIVMYYYDDKMTLQTCWIGPHTMNNWTEPCPTTFYATLQGVRKGCKRDQHAEILEDTGDL